MALFCIVILMSKISGLDQDRLTSDLRSYPDDHSLDTRANHPLFGSCLLCLCQAGPASNPMHVAVEYWPSWLMLILAIWYRPEALIMATGAAEFISGPTAPPVNVAALEAGRIRMS